jgi:hypothetical protein
VLGTHRTDRDRPAFLEEKLRGVQKIIQTDKGVSKESCRWLTSRNEAENLRVQALCQSLHYFFNRLPTDERYLCDDAESGRGSSDAVASLACLNQPPRFPVTPELDARGMPPIVLRFGSTKTTGSLFDGCDVPCMSYGRLTTSDDIRTVEAIDGSEWRFIFSMEGEKYYPNLKINPHGWQSNTFWATTSYKSEVPLPYYSRSEYNITGLPAVKYDKAIKGALFLARNCASRNHREGLVQKLQASTFRVDSLSSCLHNAEPPPGVDLGGKNQLVFQHYLFYLAFENQCVDDYITEKLWGPFAAGTVPVYFGASNVKDHAPNHSIIHVDDFPDTDQLVKYLNKVANDKTLYESYHAWRTKPLPPHFHTKYDLTETHSTCRMCRWAYARQYGLGWNSTSQRLRELVSGPRHVCLDNDGLIRQPFQESWISHTGKAVAVSPNTTLTSSAYPCTITDDNRVIFIDDRQLRRKVWYQDGVVDILLDSNAGNSTLVILQLKMPLTQSAMRPLKKMREGVWHTQDELTRFTILILPRSGAVKPSAVSGAVNVEIFNLPMRLRVIVEDIDTFHLGADRVVNFFGKLMADDFFNRHQVPL